jgi:hypothetical protein
MLIEHILLFTFGQFPDLQYLLPPDEETSSSGKRPSRRTQEYYRGVGISSS